MSLKKATNILDLEDFEKKKKKEYVVYIFHVGMENTIFHLFFKKGFGTKWF